MQFDNILPIIRQWPFIDQWNIIKEIIDRSNTKTFNVLYSCFHQFGSQDFVLVCRRLYPADSFWTISNEFTRQKKNWLQDSTIQRRYADCERDPSAYLTNRRDVASFPFIYQTIKREALRITKSAAMNSRPATMASKSAKVIAKSRQRSARERKAVLGEIFDAIDLLSSDETVLLFNFMFDGLDKRLLYFMAVYLTSKKYIDFISLLSLSGLIILENNLNLKNQVK